MQERILLPGRVKNVADTIKSAKLFVLSSDYEGMPNFLMEAMALGLPCVSTDCPCGGPKMLFGGTNQSLLVPVRNVEKLSSAMRENMKDEQTEICNRMRECAKLFNTKSVFADWEVYLKLI